MSLSTILDSVPQVEKECTKCGEVKVAQMFSLDTHKDRVGKLGSWCKSCMSHNARIWYLNNKEKADLRHTEYNKNNHEKISSSAKKYAAENPEINKRATAKYRSANKDKCRVASARWYIKNIDRKSRVYREWVVANNDLVRSYIQKRRAQRLNATVSWRGEFNEFVSIEAAHLCAMREKVTGFKWEVDHIIPLINNNVCGLHVWNNFDVLPMSVNRSKSNRIDLNNIGVNRSWL